MLALTWHTLAETILKIKDHPLQAHEPILRATPNDNTQAQRCDNLAFAFECTPMYVGTQRASQSSRNHISNLAQHNRCNAQSLGGVL